MDGQVSEKATSNPTQKSVKVCRGCGKKVFGLVDHCTKCEERFGKWGLAEKQMPTPAESPTALQDWELLPEASDPSNIGPTRLLGSMSPLNHGSRSASALGPPRSIKSTSMPQPIVPMKRQATAPFIITKKPRVLPPVNTHTPELLKKSVALEAISSRMKDSAEVPPSLQVLTEEARRQNAAIREESPPKNSKEISNNAQPRDNDQENCQPSVSSISDDMEIVRPENRSMPLSSARSAQSRDSPQPAASEVSGPHPVVQRTPIQRTTDTGLQANVVVQIYAPTKGPRQAESKMPSAGPLAPHQTAVTSTLRGSRPRKSCQTCRDKHHKCCHNDDGSYIPELCREFFDTHKGKKSYLVGLTRHQWDEMRQASGLRESDDEAADEVEEFGDEIEENFAASDESSEESESSPDESNHGEGGSGPTRHSVKLSANRAVVDDDDSDDSNDQPLANARPRWKSAAQILSPRIDPAASRPTPVSPQKPTPSPNRMKKSAAMRPSIRVQGDSPVTVQKVSSPKSRPVRTANDHEGFNEAAHLTKMRAMGVQIEEDSDEDLTDVEDEVRPARSRPNSTPFGVKVSRDLFKVAPNLRTNPNSAARPKFQVPGLPKPSKKDLWENLLAYQCRERRQMFGNPHQTIAQLPERIVTATIQESVPDASGVPGRPSIFHVNPLEQKKVKMPFREFLGGPKEPIVVRAQNDLAFIDGAEVRERKEFSSRGSHLRRLAAVEKYPFIQG